MPSWDIAVSYFREDADLGRRLVAALHERGVAVWVCEDHVPTRHEVAVEFDEPSRRFLALLMSEAALQTITFNDAFFAVVEDDVEGVYPTLAPLRVGEVELSDLPDLLKSLSPVALDEFNVEDVADRLGAS